MSWQSRSQWPQPKRWPLVGEIGWRSQLRSLRSPRTFLITPNRVSAGSPSLSGDIPEGVRGRRRGCGHGYLGSLRKNLAYANVATDSDAITKALALGVTGSPGDNNRGIGLSAIRELLQENGGTLLIRSGSGAVEHGPSTSVTDGLVPLQGTLVALRMRTDRPFEFELFEQLAAGSAQERLRAVRS